MARIIKHGNFVFECQCVASCRCAHCLYGEVIEPKPEPVEQLTLEEAASLMLRTVGDVLRHEDLGEGSRMALESVSVQLRTALEVTAVPMRDRRR